jgi:predicted amidophosphoribosyltransferase
VTPPSVVELSEPYAEFLLSPLRGPGVCEVCFDFTPGGRRCSRCSGADDALSAFAPISYSIGGEQLHHALLGYKRLTDRAARQLERELGAVLWRFLSAHEACVARAARVDAFEIVATVPSGDRDRDLDHPMRGIVGELVGPTHDRYKLLLTRSVADVAPRTVEAKKFKSLRALDGESVLLIDDTWTTGASAQSAAAALREAGAGAIAAVAIGRHVNREWGDNDRRLQALAQQAFDWDRCALCAGSRPKRR